MTTSTCTMPPSRRSSVQNSDLETRFAELQQRIEGLELKVNQIEGEVVALRREGGPKSPGRPVGSAVQRVKSTIEAIVGWNQIVQPKDRFAITAVLLKEMGASQKVAHEYVESVQTEIDRLNGQSGFPTPLQGKYNRGKDFDRLKVVVVQWLQLESQLSERKDREMQLKQLVQSTLKLPLEEVQKIINSPRDKAKDPTQRVDETVEVIAQWNQLVASDRSFAITIALLLRLGNPQEVATRYVRSEAEQIKQIHDRSKILEPVNPRFNRGKPFDHLKKVVSQWVEVEKPDKKRDRQAKLKNLISLALKQEQD